MAIRQWMVWGGIGVALMVGGLPAEARKAPLALERPACQPQDVHGGHCYAPNMRAAVKITRSPAFHEVQATVARRAQAYLNTLTPSANQVVIADLDETLLSNVDYYARHRQQEPESWTRWLNGNKNGPYIDPVKTLLQNAQAKGFSVMYITGRPAEFAPATWRQTAGFAWDGGFHKPKGVKMTAQTYKTQVRDMLQALGYTVVLNIGDQVSDHGAPLAESRGEFLMPNVMYVIP